MVHLFFRIILLQMQVPTLLRKSINQRFEGTFAMWSLSIILKVAVNLGLSGLDVMPVLSNLWDFVVLRRTLLHPKMNGAAICSFFVLVTKNAVLKPNGDLLQIVVFHCYWSLEYGKKCKQNSSRSKKSPTSNTPKGKQRPLTFLLQGSPPQDPQIYQCIT